MLKLVIIFVVIGGNMEIIDVKFKEGKYDFHYRVVGIIIKDDKYLIQNIEGKDYFVLPGGHVRAGENSDNALIREIKEEVGLDIDVKTARHIGTTIRYYKNCPDILDVWLFKSDADISEITIQEEEVNDVMWADKKKILDLHYAGKFEANAFFGDVISNAKF